MIIESHDFIGIVGAVCVLVSYLLLQSNKMSPSSFSYSGLNLVGAILIMFSLANAWNLTAFIIETIWAIISLYGLVKWYALHRQSRNDGLS